MTGRAMPWPRRLRYLAEAAGFFVVIGFFRLFPVERASAVGAWIGRVGVAPTSLSKLARENLRAAYPDKTAEQIEALIRAMWDNLGRVLAEYAHLDKIRWKTARPRIEVSGVEHIAEAQAVEPAIDVRVIRRTHHRRAGQTKFVPDNGHHFPIGEMRRHQ